MPFLVMKVFMIRLAVVSALRSTNPSLNGIDERKVFVEGRKVGQRLTNPDLLSPSWGRLSLYGESI